ncbi:hypothetical protein V8G54_005187, partial [Vigna mungo]
PTCCFTQNSLFRCTIQRKKIDKLYKIESYLPCISTYLDPLLVSVFSSPCHRNHGKETSITTVTRKLPPITNTAKLNTNLDNSPYLDGFHLLRISLVDVSRGLKLSLFSIFLRSPFSLHLLFLCFLT